MRTLPSHDDAISGVRFAPPGANHNHLLSSSWDSTLAVSDIDNAKFALRVQFRAPLLSCCWGPGGQFAYAGGVERRVSVVDIASGEFWDVGDDHSQAVSSIVSVEATNSVISASFDRSLQNIDIRTERGVFYPLGKKVFAVDAAGTLLIAALTDNVVNGYDVRKVSEPLFSRKMYYDHPLRSLRCIPTGHGYAVSSLKSRVTIENIEPRRSSAAGSPAQNSGSPRTPAKVEIKEFSFRTNRRQKPGTASSDNEYEAYPVNALAFNPQIPGLVATGGSDQTVQVWNYHSKVRATVIENLPYAVTQLDYSRDGKHLAIGTHNDAFRMAPAMSSRAISSALLVKEV